MELKGSGTRSKSWVFIFTQLLSSSYLNEAVFQFLLILNECKAHKLIFQFSQPESLTKTNFGISLFSLYVSIAFGSWWRRQPVCYRSTSALIIFKTIQSLFLTALLKILSLYLSIKCDGVCNCFDENWSGFYQSLRNR